MLKWLKREFQKHIAQDVPNALARCEFECRVGQCSRGEWEQCENRIALAEQLEERVSGMITPAAWPPGSSNNAAGSDPLDPDYAPPVTLTRNAQDQAGWPGGKRT